MQHKVLVPVLIYAAKVGIDTLIRYLERRQANKK